MKNIFNFLLGSGWILALKIIFYLYLIVPLSQIKSLWIYTKAPDQSGLLGVFALNMLYMFFLAVFLFPASILWMTTLKVDLLLKIVFVILITCAVPIAVFLFSLGVGSKLGIVVYYGLYLLAAFFYIYMLYKFQSR